MLAWLLFFIRENLVSIRFVKLSENEIITSEQTNGISFRKTDVTCNIRIDLFGSVLLKVSFIMVTITNSLYHDRHIALKCLIFVYKTLHILFGLDLGFMKFKSCRVKIAPKIVAVIQCIFHCIFAGKHLFRTDMPIFFGIRFSFFLLHYFMCALMLTFIKYDSTFCNLFHDLRTIDLGLKVNHASYNLEVKLMLSMFTCLLFKISLGVNYCMYFTFCAITSWNSVLFVLALFASDVILITCAFMFYAINSRLKKLVSLLKAENSDFLSTQYLYKSIVDIAERHKVAFDPVVSR